MSFTVLSQTLLNLRGEESIGKGVGDTWVKQ